MMNKENLSDVLKRHKQRLLNEELLTIDGYRPYLTENELPFKVGDIVVLRCKTNKPECKGSVFKTIVNGIYFSSLEPDRIGKLSIGGGSYYPSSVLKLYELLVNGEWQPFGVVDE